MNRTLPVRVIADAYVPYLETLEGDPRFEVTRLTPDGFTADAVRDADALIIRTRTRCDSALLTGSRVSFIATATIGFDHIDREWCAGAGIETVNAPGCNAPAVAQYVLTALLDIHGDLTGRTLGVVGVGHVGSIVSRWARGLGMNVVECDPPRAEAGDGDGFVPLERLLEVSDIVTLHTPLTRAGRHATYHLADKEFVSRARHGFTLVNAARGAVADTAALIRGIDDGQIGNAVIDVWEGEPAISLELLCRARIATPHIAGYSAQGKRRASAMALAALYRHFGMAVSQRDSALFDIPARVTAAELTGGYDIHRDMASLLGAPERFEALRDGYVLRDEPGHTSAG